jgi:transcription elongation factor S-II
MTTTIVVTKPDDFREKIACKLNSIFGVPGAKHGHNLEKGIYNWTIKEATNRKVIKKWDNKFFVQIYTDKFRSTVLNLNRPETNLIQQVNENAIKPHAIAFMTHQEMSPHKWGPLLEAKIKRDMNKYETKIEAATDTFTCRKCHSKKCTYYQMQTRSADEPMTTFVSCIDCGKRWKC